MASVSPKIALEAAFLMKLNRFKNIWPNCKPVEAIFYGSTLPMEAEMDFIKRLTLL
jgi:hypothetical protein